MSFEEARKSVTPRYIDFLSTRYTLDELKEHIKKDNWYDYLYYQPSDNCELIEILPVQDWPRFVVEPIRDVFTCDILGYPFIVEYGNYFNHLSVASEWSKY